MEWKSIGISEKYYVVYFKNNTDTHKYTKHVRYWFFLLFLFFYFFLIFVMYDMCICDKGLFLQKYDMYVCVFLQKIKK